MPRGPENGGWWKAAAIIIGAVGVLVGLGFVAPWQAASTKDLDNHKSVAVQVFETKAHAKETHQRIEKAQEKLDTQLEQLNVNVIKIGERLRIRDMRKDDSP